MNKIDEVLKLLKSQEAVKDYEFQSFEECSRIHSAIIQNNSLKSHLSQKGIQILTSTSYEYESSFLDMLLFSMSAGLRFLDTLFFENYQKHGEHFLPVKTVNHTKVNRDVKIYLNSASIGILKKYSYRSGSKYLFFLEPMN